MAGKPGRSGRRKGSISYPKNPVALAGHHLNVLKEMWLSGAPISGVEPRSKRAQSVPPVPPTIGRRLAEIVISHLLNIGSLAHPPDIQQVLEWSRRHPPRSTVRVTSDLRLARRRAGAAGGKAKQRNVTK